MAKGNVNGKSKAGRKRKQLTIPGIPEGLQLSGNPIVGFRVPRGLLEDFDKRIAGGRALLRENAIKFMARAVAK